MGFPERDHLFEETKNVLIRLELGPVKPTEFVVLVIGIVVAELCVQELIASPEHWYAIRQQKQTAEVLHLFPAKRHDVRRYSFMSFMTAVPAVILIHSILVVLTIRPVVFMVVRNEVVKCEAVVGIDIIHGLVRVIGIGTAVRKKIVAAINATHQVRDHSPIALDKTTNIITKPRIPLEPGQPRKSTSELIRAGVPGFCDQLQQAQFGIGGDFTEDRSISPI